MDQNKLLGLCLIAVALMDLFFIFRRAPGLSNATQQLLKGVFTIGAAAFFLLGAALCLGYVRLLPLH